MHILAKTVVLMSLGAWMGTANAALVIAFEEVGGNVVATGSGSALLADLTYLTTYDNDTAGVTPSLAAAVVGSPDEEIAILWTGIAGPSSFGSGTFTAPTSGGGDKFGLWGQVGGNPIALLHLPNGYSSGDPLSSSSTYAGASFASLGLTPGTYTWASGTGPTADSLRINIGPVPEPGAWAMASGVLCLAAVAARRSRRS